MTLRERLRRKYYFFRKLRNDEKFRYYYAELKKDLKRTKSEVFSWASKGSTGADDKRLVILSFTKVPIYAKFHATIGKIGALNGYKPIIITNRGNYLVYKYYQWFGINEIVDWAGFEANETDENLVSLAVRELSPKKFTLQNLIGIEYHGVQVGKHTLSMVCRTRLEGQLDFNDSDVQELLIEFFRKSIRSVIATEVFLSKYKVSKMLVRDSGYIPNGGIFETALVNGVDCVVHEFGQELGTWVFKRHDLNNRNEHYFGLSKETWQDLKDQPWEDYMQKDLDSEFKERYKPDSLSDTRRLQYGKKLYTPEEVYNKLILDPSKKTAVLFSHVPWDATFFYGSCIFGDYERWLYETVKYLIKNGSEMNWIIKLHPYNAFKLQRESKDEESELRLLRPLLPLPKNMVIMKADTEINTQSLFPIIDYVLTVNGTVGMEFPCFGIPSVLAGTGRYDGRGFTYDNDTIEEYYQTLDKLHTLQPLTEEQTLYAKKHFYYIMCRRQTDLQEIIPMELKKFHEAQSELHNNVSFKPRSLKEFQETESYKLLSDWFFNGTSYDVLNQIKNQ